MRFREQSKHATLFHSNNEVDNDIDPRLPELLSQKDGDVDILNSDVTQILDVNIRLSCHGVVISIAFATDTTATLKLRDHNETDNTVI